MSDDYLWDRSGPPDPEIARLEALLRPFGHPQSVLSPTLRVGSLRSHTTVDAEHAENSSGFVSATAAVSALNVMSSHTLKPDTARGKTIQIKPDTTDAKGVQQPVRAYGWVRVGLAAAAVVLLAAGGWWQTRRSVSTSWDVTIFDGSLSAPSKRVTAHRDLPIGSWLETGEREKAFIKVADIGNVNVDPRTRIRLIRTRAGDHRVELARGTMHATILAPPGQFFVETPSATVVDLGCAYTLTVDDKGAGLVTVILGWVGFEWRGRESLIPAGFIAATRPRLGPGTPYHTDASAEVRAALEAIDFDPSSPGTSAALGIVLSASGERDEATLWHLLSRVPPSERDRVFDRLARFVPPPPTVTREGIRDGRREMLDQWWDAIGLGTIAWWRNWKIQGPHR